MPYANEHAARVRNPDDFQQDSFRRKNVTEGVDIILGRLKGQTTTTTQSYRFSVKKFTEAEARKWLKDNDVQFQSFEPAKQAAAGAPIEPKEITINCTLAIEAAHENEDAPRIGPRRFSMAAYGGGPMQLDNYPLPVVIDIQGMKIPRRKMPTYLDHKREQIVGHTDQHDKTDGTHFTASGLVSGATEYSQQVLTSYDDGFPWQASLGVMPISGQVVVLQPGRQARINGRTVVGPAILARRSTLRHIAFVSEGADETTTIAIAASAANRKRRTSMEFQEWVENLGLSLGELTDIQQSKLEEKFEAEMKAAKGKTPESIQASRADDGFKVADILLICEQHNAKVEAEKVRYQSKVPHKRLSELHQGAMEAAAGLKTESLEGQWPSYKVELEAVKRLADFQKRLVEASLPEPPPIVNFGGDQFPEIMEAAFCRNAGLGNMEKVFQPAILEASDKYKSVGLHELLLQCAHRNGYSGRMTLTADNLRDVMLAAFSSSTVTTMLTQAGDKFLLDGFERVPQRWREVCSTRSVSNFRQHTGFRLTASMEYVEVPASGELQHGDVGQESWNIQAKTYGRIFAITRADIVNDDLGAFDALRTRIGMGAALKMADVFWTAWLAAVNGAAFWTSARGNYQSGATTALGDAALSAAIQLFRAMTGPDGNLLDMEPDRLMVPPDIEATARKLYVSQEMRDTTANTRLPVANIHQNRFRPIVVPQLSNSNYTGYSTTHWFLCADPRLLASAEMAFLNGREQPTVESSNADFNTLGIQLRAYHDFGVAMSEYRASVLSTGA